MGQLDKKNHYSKVMYSSEDRDKSAEVLRKSLVKKLNAFKAADTSLVYEIISEAKDGRLKIDFIPKLRKKIDSEVLQTLIGEGCVEFKLRVKDKYISVTRGNYSRSPISRVYYDRVEQKAQRVANKLWDLIKPRIGKNTKEAEFAFSSEQALKNECAKYNLDIRQISWSWEYGKGKEGSEDVRCLRAKFNFEDKYSFRNGIELRYNPFAKAIDRRTAKFSNIESGMIEAVLESLEIPEDFKSSILKLMNESENLSFRSNQLDLKCNGGRTGNETNWDIALNSLSQAEFSEIIPVLTAMTL